MVRALIPLLVCALAGCAPSGAPTAPMSAAEAACTNQANSSPAVEADLAKQAGNLDYQWQHAAQIRQTKQDAITACLRSRGLASRGGVERPR